MFNSEFAAAVPLVCVLLGAMAVLAAESLRRPGERMPLAGLGLVGLAGAAVSSVLLWDRNALGFGVVLADNFGLFVTLVAIVVAALTILFSSQVIERDNLPAGEYYTLVLFATVGLILMATADDLLVLFVALEIVSLAVYVLTGVRRTLVGTEAAFKYFLLGAFASAFFLYGIAFTYGVAGSTRLPEVGAYLSAQALVDDPLVLVAMGLLIVGFAFKIAVVPFHMWTPDAYEGAPALVTGFMSTGVKAAAVAAFARVFLSAFEPFTADWVPIVAALAVLTMVLGTVVGVAQHNLKRMLAYSSIAHGGYLLVAIVAANEVGKAALLFYLLAYSVTNLVAFGVIALLGSKDGESDDLRHYAGLWQTHPVLAVLMTVSLLSLGGLPPTAGFIAKWYVFSAAVSAGHYGLAIIGVLTSVISVFFYLRVVVMMYMSDRDAVPAPAQVAGLGMAALAVATAAIVYLGILPTAFIDLAAASVATIF